MQSLGGDIYFAFWGDGVPPSPNGARVKHVSFPARALHRDLRSHGLKIMVRGVAKTVARHPGSDSSLLKLRVKKNWSSELKWTAGPDKGMQLLFWRPSDEHEEKE